MTLGTAYSWFPVGERLCVPYEAPQGRRVNGVGLLIAHGPQAGSLQYRLRAKLPTERSKKTSRPLAERAQAHGVRPEEVGPLDADVLLDFIWEAAGRPTDAPEDWQRERPLYIYVDNYSAHTGKVFQDARPKLEAADIHLEYLPSYTPEMSDIEPVWNDVKYHRMTQRSFERLGDLMSALAKTFDEKARDLLACDQSHTLSTGAT